MLYFNVNEKFISHYILLYNYILFLVKKWSDLLNLFFIFVNIMGQ